MSIAVEIAGYGICITARPYVVMVLFVQQANFQAWTVYRLYNSFEALSEQLRQVVPTTPPVPTFDQNNHNPDYLELARHELDIWLKDITLNEFIFRTQSMYLFLCAEANQPPPFLEIHWCNSDNGSFDEMDMEMEDMFDREGQTGHTPREDYPGDEAETESDASPASGNDVWSFQGSAAAAASGASSISASSVSGSGHKSKRRSSHKRPSLKPDAMIEENDGLDIQSISLVQGAEFLYDREEEEQQKRLSIEPTPIVPAPRRTISLESFHIIKVIGKGSFGKVFLVRDKARKTLHALKVLRKEHIIKKNQVEHTKTERSVLGYVHHPFIVGLTMAFQTQDKLFFVLDYCSGGELFFHLGKAGRFTEERSMFYAAQITLALEHVHGLGIIYRDLKPENVLLDHLGNVRLTDFGLSKEGVSHSSSGANSFCGTPEYIAPEVLLRQGHGRAVDWWSLGALLYEMITGLPPFYSRNRDTMFDKIMKAELSFPPFMNRTSKDILSRLLVRDPTARMGSGERDAAELKEHPFFTAMDFIALYEGRVSTPWIPVVSGSLDTSQFDAEFTSMQPTVSPADVRGAYFGSLDAAFEGFTFVDESVAHLMAQAVTGASAAAGAGAGGKASSGHRGHKK